MSGLTKMTTRKGKTAAAHMRTVLALMAEAEDREWAKKALRARKQGFITRAESATLTRRLRRAIDIRPEAG